MKNWRLLIIVCALILWMWLGYTALLAGEKIKQRESQASTCSDPTFYVDWNAVQCQPTRD